MGYHLPGWLSYDRPIRIQEDIMKKIKLTDDEVSALIYILIEFRNELIREERTTDLVDEIIMKLS